MPIPRDDDNSSATQLNMTFYALFRTPTPLATRGSKGAGGGGGGGRGGGGGGGGRSLLREALNNAVNLEMEEDATSSSMRDSLEPPFQQLFVSVPVGLAVQFLPESSVGIPFDFVGGSHKVNQSVSQSVIRSIKLAYLSVGWKIVVWLLLLIFVYVPLV